MDEQNTTPAYPYNVLFVDDDPNIVSSLRRGLLAEPYNKFYALTAKEALQIMEETPIHVLVTDMRMPTVSGLDLLKIVESTYPRTIKMVLSGYAQLPQILATINQVSLFRFIQKPWNLEDEFKPAILSAIAQYEKTMATHGISDTAKQQLEAMETLIQLQGQLITTLVDSYHKKAPAGLEQLISSADIEQLDSYLSLLTLITPSQQMSTVKGLNQLIHRLLSGAGHE